jgi:hypothetical protein
MELLDTWKVENYCSNDRSIFNIFILSFFLIVFQCSSNERIFIELISIPVHLAFEKTGILNLRKADGTNNAKIKLEENISELGSSVEIAKKRREFANTEIDSKLAELEQI